MLRLLLLGCGRLADGRLVELVRPALLTGTRLVRQAEYLSFTMS